MLLSNPTSFQLSLYGVGRAQKAVFGKTEERAHLGGCLLSKHLFWCLQSADIMDPAVIGAEMSSAEGFILYCSMII